jgi:hypothetical protein
VVAVQQGAAAAVSAAGSTHGKAWLSLDPIPDNAGMERERTDRCRVNTPKGKPAFAVISTTSQGTGPRTPSLTVCYSSRNTSKSP